MLRSIYAVIFHRHAHTFGAWFLFSALLVVAALMVGNAALAGAVNEPRVMPISGCNAQAILNGDATIFWTSSFSDGAYPFAEANRSGNIVSGEGGILEVTVQRSVEGAGASAFTDIGFHGTGFSPGGVSGEFVDQGPVTPTATEDPAACGVDVNASSYGSHTFLFTFTGLHKPGRRPLAKGNGELNVFIDVGGEQARLGTNLHVATGPDPDKL